MNENNNGVVANNEEIKFVFYAGQKIPVPSTLTVDEIKQGLSQMYPRLGADDVVANIADNGDVTFYVPAGEKGSDEPSSSDDTAAETSETVENTTAETASDVKFVFYAGQKIPVPVSLTVDEIKAGLSQMYPRLGADDVVANVADNGDVTFYVPAGEKGSDEPSSSDDNQVDAETVADAETVETSETPVASDVKFVFYAGQKIPVPVSLTVDEIKQGLSQMYPRLGADDVVANVADNGDVTFYVPAGEKGSDEPSSPDDTVESDASETTAEAPASDVKFVFYAGQKIPVPVSLTVDEIKQGLSQMYPRLGADDVVANVADNGDVTFYVPAGEKGSK